YFERGGHKQRETDADEHQVTGPDVLNRDTRFWRSSTNFHGNPPVESSPREADPGREKSNINHNDLRTACDIDGVAIWETVSQIKLPVSALYLLAANALSRQSKWTAGRPPQQIVAASPGGRFRARETGWLAFHACSLSQLSDQVGNT